jgi:hypothetical protein
MLASRQPCRVVFRSVQVLPIPSSIVLDIPFGIRCFYWSVRIGGVVQKEYKISVGAICFSVLVGMRYMKEAFGG